MKMKTHNIMKKILSLVLVAILTINIATPSTSVEASQKGNTVTKTVDGIKYRIEKTVKNGVIMSRFIKETAKTIVNYI